MNPDPLTGTVKAAAIQATPVFLDLDATVEKACRLIGETADQGARIMVFPETFLPGYPFWPRDNTGPSREPILKAFVSYFRNSIEIPSPQTDALREAAVQSVLEVARAEGYRLSARADSRLAGPKGNREIFLLLESEARSGPG